jgi:hypothetical protein
MSSTPPVPRELHVYYDESTRTADVVVVYSLGSGHLADKFNGPAHLDFSHEHRSGGAAPSTDSLRLGVDFRDARQRGTGRHRAITPDAAA